LPIRLHNDANSASPKSFRDKNYVAMTRARKTLAVVLTKWDKTKAPTLTETMPKIANRAMHKLAEARGLMGVELDYECSASETSSPLSGFQVGAEVSHTALEAGMTCRVKHDFLFRRQMPTMTPFSMPDYSF